MRDNKLTRRQRQVLDFITESIEERGYPPTLREIGEHLEIRSTNGVNDHLKALERKGYLVRDDLKSRALRPRGLKTDNANMVSVPLVGDVAAGDPILAIEQAEDSVQIDRFFIGSGEGVFALRIKGESMINDGIYDGDFIFVRKQLTANRGDIVVAMIEGEATCAVAAEGAQLGAVLLASRKHPNGQGSYPVRQRGAVRLHRAPAFGLGQGLLRTARREERRQRPPAELPRLSREQLLDLGG